jgi:hypothetical protein
VAQVVQALEEFVAELGERQSRDAEASPPVRPKPGQRPDNLLRVDSSQPAAHNRLLHRQLTTGHLVTKPDPNRY